jgi:hypothetical protein
MSVEPELANLIVPEHRAVEMKGTIAKVMSLYKQSLLPHSLTLYQRSMAERQDAAEPIRYVCKRNKHN